MSKTPIVKIKDLSEVENTWLNLQTETIQHDWHCDCSECAERLALGRVLTEQREREFVLRGKRLEQGETAYQTETEKPYNQKTLNPSKPFSVGGMRI